MIVIWDYNLNETNAFASQQIFPPSGELLVHLCGLFHFDFTLFAKDFQAVFGRILENFILILREMLHHILIKRIYEVNNLHTKGRYGQNVFIECNHARTSATKKGKL